jgi:transcriptional regulator with XRE-family HTH domain
MSSLLQQFKKRRLALGLKQNDMMFRVGVSRQQYQRLEAKGNPRLDTLELIATGLNSEIMLVPKEKLSAVLAVLENDDTELPKNSAKTAKDAKALSDDPWQGLLGNEQ